MSKNLDLTMLRIITMLFVLFFSSMALACDLSLFCPDDDELNDLNQLIAEYQAKLEFVQAGYKENRSGIPNKPEILEAKIAAFISARDSTLRAISECRKQCVLEDTYTQQLLAACPECQDKQTTYQEALDKYTAKLAEVDSFKKKYQLENVSAYKAAYTKLIANQKKLKQAQQELREIQDQDDKGRAETSIEKILSFYRALLGNESRAKKFSEEVLRPLVDERDRLYKSVPNTGAGFTGLNSVPDAEAMLSALTLLEKQLDDANFVRDKALEALINCNLTHCGTTQNANNLFMPGGLYGPAAGSPGWNGITISEALTAPNADARTPAQKKATVANDGAFLEPDFGSLIVSDDIFIDVPEVPADVQAQLAALAENNEVYIPPQVCELIPSQICQHLDESFESECVTRFTQNIRMCKQLQTQMLSDSPLPVCNGVCNYTEVTRLDGHWLLEQVFRTIDLRVESRLDSSEAVKKMSLRNQLRQLRVEQENLNNIPETRKHLLYENTETGLIFKHFGLYFEPQPPLVYVGKEKGKRTQPENDRLQTLASSIVELEKEITSVTLADTLIIDWADQAKSVWQRLMPCQREQIPEQAAMCRTECDVALGRRTDNYRWTTTFCDPAGVIGFSHSPSAKAWMYPPD